MSGNTLIHRGGSDSPRDLGPKPLRQRRIPLRRLAFLLAFAAVQGVAGAAVYVDVDHSGGTQDGTSWATAFPTIQEGIDAAFASGGDDVWIAEGTYSEALVMKSGVALYGGFVGSETALSERDIETYVVVVDGGEADGGSPADHVVTLSSVSNARLDGLTITGGSATTGLSVPGYGILGAGGGMYCVNAGDTNIIARCRIVDNYATAGGGGIFCDGASPTIFDCEINGNSATNIYAVPTGGGGICAIEDSSPYVANTVISGNRGNYAGGILCFDASSPLLYNCVISGNWADTAGGGIGCALNSDPVITNCTISSNSAPVAGGLTCGWEFLSLPYGNSDPIVTNTIFHSNTNYAVYERLTDSDPLVRYCLFDGNPDGDWFDENATAYTGASTFDPALPEASNNLDGDSGFTMGATATWVSAPAYNATTNRTALVAASGSFTTDALVGMTINPNTAQYQQALVTDNTTTTVYVAGDVTGFVSNGDTYLVVDYHLTSSSAGLDAGTDGVSISVTIPTNDLDGQARPFDYPGVDNNGALPDYDIGADEWSSDPANTAPIAGDDAYEVIQGQTLDVSAPGLLDNDTDAEFDPLTAELDTDVTNGTLTLNADGSFSYEHDGGASTSDTFTYNAFDGEAYSDTPATVTITVVAGNRPPVLAPIGDRQVEMENLLQFTISASDPDAGDTLTYSADGLPSGATFTPATRTFSWTPTESQTGLHENIVFTVTDDGEPQLDDSETITITVSGGNNPPVLDPIGDKYVAPGDYVDFTITASDPDPFQVLTYEVDNLPAGAQWWPGARRVTWSTSAADEGVHENIVFTVTDNGTPPLNDSETIAIVVGDINRPPVLDPIGDKQVDEGQLLEFTISGSDPDPGQTVTLAASGLPTGATFSPSTGTFSWTPGYHDSGGPYNVTFTVTDDGLPQEEDSEVVAITVNDVNRPPVLASIGNKAVDEGDLLAFGVSATDVDGDSLVLDAANLPDGAVFTDNGDGTGSFSWQVGYQVANDSPFTVTFVVFDTGASPESDSEVVTIDVTNVNTAPVAVDDSYSVAQGGQLNVAAPGVLENDTDAEDDPLTAQLVSQPPVGTLAFNGESGAFIYLPGSTTETQVTFTYYANDGEALSQTPATVTINIEGPADISVPNVVGLTESQAQSAITSAGLVVGDTLDAYDPSVPVGLILHQTPPAGTVVSAATPVDLVVSLGAATPVTLYVDADNTSGVEDGSAAHPFNTIGEAVDASEHGRGDTIVVMPGVYAETVTLKMNTTLRSQAGSYQTHLVSAKVSGDVLTLAEGCVVRGFTLGSAASSALEVPAWTSATVSNCVAHSSSEGLHAAEGARVDLMNSTLVSNDYGLKADLDAVVTQVKNTIFDSNNVAIASDPDALEAAARNCYFGNVIDLQGPSHAPTDLAADPLFVDAAALNLHLRAASPCRDAGTLDAALNDLDGSRNDIGADGGPYGVQDTVAPIASIDADVTEGDAPLTVNFSGAASTDEWGIASYSWDFDAADGVGVDAQGVDAQHTFTDSAAYTVTLTVVDNSGLVAQTTTDITVGVLNVIAWVEPMAGQAPLEVNFYTELLGPAVGNVTCAWDSNGDGITDFIGRNPVRTFATPMAENYVVTVTATDEADNSAQDTVRFAVLEVAPLEASLAGPGGDTTVSVEDSGTELDGVSVFIPAGALLEPAVVAVAPVPDPPLASPPFVGAPVQFVPGGVTFDPPATVTLVHPAETDHPIPFEVRYYDAATGRWSSEGISNVQHVDGVPNHTVTFETTHFTIFAMTPELRQTDVNLDISVNAVDVQLTINAALGLLTDYPHTDVNEDGTANAIDVQRVINGALGLE